MNKINKARPNGADLSSLLLEGTETRKLKVQELPILQSKSKAQAAQLTEIPSQNRGGERDWGASSFGKALMAQA